MPALDRFHCGIAALADRQIISARVARPLLGGAYQPYRVRPRCGAPIEPDGVRPPSYVTLATPTPLHWFAQGRFGRGMTYLDQNRSNPNGRNRRESDIGLGGALLASRSWRHLSPTAAAASVGPACLR